MALRGIDKYETQRRIANERKEVSLAFAGDPWMGYDTLDDALADYKCSTKAEVMARILNRENVFISGPAGSGKTSLIEKFIKLIDAEYGGKFEIAVTASTGKAATVLGGTTIHSWAGLGIDSSPFDTAEISNAMRSKRKQMKFADVLIIDEISMVSDATFQKLDDVLRWARHSNEPFGGLQVILMGDFLQLPPVEGNFATKSTAWTELNLAYCYMDKTFRAKDPRLAEILSKMSRDVVDNEVRELIQSRIGVAKEVDRTYTTLYTTNQNVDKYNQAQQDLNPSKLEKLTAHTSGPAEEVKKIYKNYGIPEVVELKVGDTVLLTANTILDEHLLANGSLGKITAIVRNVVTVYFNGGRSHRIDRKVYAAYKREVVFDSTRGKESVIEVESARVEQVPLKLGYAITVHKSQGQTLDSVVTNLARCFTPGLGYVALSRVRSLDDLIIEGFSDEAFRIDPKSKFLSNFVKNRALAKRKEFEENRPEYENILKSERYRGIIWDVSTSGAERRPKK